MNLVKKTVPIEVTYWVGRQDPARGVFEGGVPDPEHLDELHIDVSDDEMWDEAAGRFASTGRTQINLSGSRRAYLEFARFLLAVIEVATETADPDYHTHLDSITNAAGKPAIHLIVHGCRPDPGS
jgi:hypothetical protein